MPITETLLLLWRYGFSKEAQFKRGGI